MKLSETFDKNYLARVGLYVASAALALGAIIYMAYHLIDRFSPGLELIDAVPTTVTKVIETDAYIMRDEQPIHAKSAGGGSVVPSVKNGERMAIYQKIADVYSNSSPDIEARLFEIDEQIELLDSTVDSDRSVQSSSRMDSSIYESIFKLRTLCDRGYYDEALSMRTSLLVDIKKRDILTGGVTDYSSQISKLQAEKNSLRSELGVCLESIYSSSTGYYFSDCDGYGTVFSSKNVDTLTFYDFAAMIESEPDEVSGSCIGVMVHDYKWYIACLMKKSEAASLVDMYSCSITFTYSNRSLDMVLYRTIPETPGDDVVVIFQCETLPENFDYTRMQPIEISAVEYTGFYVPIAAVRIVNGFEGVYILDEVTIEFRRINIIYEDDGYVICTGSPDETISLADGEKVTDSDDEIYPWIRQNDIIVVSGTELYSGKVIG